MPEDARDRILAAAMRLVIASAGMGVTVEAVAREAGCAKGLVAYHFKTKNALFAEADRHIANRRRLAWTTALRTNDPHGAIDAIWKAILDDGTSGVARYAADKLTDWSDNEGFVAAVGREAVALLRRAGRRPTVEESELADLCGVALPGFAEAVAGGGDPARLEGAHAAFWAGMFALTTAG